MMSPAPESNLWLDPEHYFLAYLRPVNANQLAISKMPVSAMPKPEVSQNVPSVIKVPKGSDKFAKMVERKTRTYCCNKYFYAHRYEFYPGGKSPWTVEEKDCWITVHSY